MLHEAKRSCVEPKEEVTVRKFEIACRQTSFEQQQLTRVLRKIPSNTHVHEYACILYTIQSEVRSVYRAKGIPT